MSAKPDLLDADLILSGLETKWLGKNCYAFTRWTLPMQWGVHGPESRQRTVILAERQTQGKGRMARSWPPTRRNLDEHNSQARHASGDAYRLNMIASIALARDSLGFTVFLPHQMA